MIQIYSMKNDAEFLLAPHFQVREFACKDGTDTVIISGELVPVLEKIRTAFDRSVIVLHGYHSVEYDKQIGGNGKSYYTKGMAADIAVSGVNPATVAYYAQSLLGRNGGIVCVCDPKSAYVHLDMRSSKLRAVKAFANSAYERIYGNLFPSITKGNGGQSVVVLQRLLTAHGYDCGTVDGICGFQMRQAIKEFQQSVDLDDDGICGPMTWEKILGITKLKTSQ